MGKFHAYVRVLLDSQPARSKDDKWVDKMIELMKTPQKYNVNV